MRESRMESNNAPPYRRCAIYTRKSVEDGLEQEFNSLDAQREAGEAYIASQKSNGWVCIPTHYDDGGFSGGNTSRPALQQLLKDCEAGLIDTVVVYKVDRLSRSLCDFTDLSKDFAKWNVAFVSVTQQIDTSTSAGKMMLNMLMAFAEYEREIIGERIRDKFAASKRKGIWMGGCVPLGYRVEKRKLVVVPEEAEIVRRVFRRYLESQSPVAVAKELIEAGVKTKKGNNWSMASVIRLLHNPIYIGKLTYKGEVVEGEQEGILDLKLWDGVQKCLGRNPPRRHPGRQAQYSAPLRGLLFCGHCGGAMTPYSKTKNGKRYVYYECVRDKKRAIHTCPIRHIEAGMVEDIVLERLSGILRTPELALTLSGMSGLDEAAVMRTLDGSFWKKATPDEKARMLELLVASVTLYEDKMDIEVRTEGLTCAMEEIENESDQD